VGLTPEQLKQMHQAELTLRQIRTSQYGEVEIELEDDLAIFILGECATRNWTPSEFIEHAILQLRDKSDGNNLDQARTDDGN